MLLFEVEGDLYFFEEEREEDILLLEGGEEEDLFLLEGENYLTFECGSGSQRRTPPTPGRRRR